MIPQKPNPSIKNYCYKSPDCEIVETGAVQSIWLVCRTCKEEVSEILKNSIEKKTTDQIELELEHIYRGYGYP